MICIAGKNQIAVDCAQHILENYSSLKLFACINKNDSGHNTWQPSFKKWATENNVELLSLSEASIIPNLIFISLEFDRIIVPSSFASKNLFNIHFSYLPEYKGMYTSIWPILDGKSFTGVSLHRIDHGIDTGDIIAQKKIEISPEVRSRDLYDSFLMEGTKIFREFLPRIISTNISSFPQPSSNSSYNSKNSIDFKLLTIDLNQTAQSIHNQIRAFSFPEYQLPKILDHYVSSSRITNERSNRSPGKKIFETERTLTFTTIDYNIEIQKDPFTRFINYCELGDTSSAERALIEISNIEEQNTKGWTPLMVASYHGHDMLVRILLERGANVNSTNFKGTSVLMYATSSAIRTNHTRILGEILAAGATSLHKDHSGRTVFDYEENQSNPSVLDFIRRSTSA